MDVVCPQDYLSCSNGKEIRKPSFEFLEIPRGREIVCSLSHSKILFVLEGGLQLTFKEVEGRVIPKGKAILFPSDAYFESYATEDTILIVCTLFDVVQLCDHFSLKNLFDGSEDFEYDLDLLDINEPLKKYLDSINMHMISGLKCYCFFDLKVKELFYLLQIYYPQEALVRFLYPLLNSDIEFSNFVETNYRKVKTVKELSDLSNYSLSGFVKRFKKAFGKSPHQWMKEQKAKDIFQEIENGEKLFKEISYEYGFSSPAHFNAFCKTHFGESPGEIRRKNRFFINDFRLKKH